jgi:hypothetical protein
MGNSVFVENFAPSDLFERRSVLKYEKYQNWIVLATRS